MDSACSCCSPLVLRAMTCLLAVPWNERDLVALVKNLLPEGQLVCLRDQGITELPLDGLNTIVARHRLLIRATMVRDRKRFVACTDKDGQVEPSGRFELRQIQPEALGHTHERRHEQR